MKQLTQYTSGTNPEDPSRDLCVSGYLVFLMLADPRDHAIVVLPNRSLPRKVCCHWTQTLFNALLSRR
jgi:hypothetical protein